MWTVKSIRVVDAKDVFLGGKAVCDDESLTVVALVGEGTFPNMLGRLDEHIVRTSLIDVLA